jgi:hypothetical protein
MCSRQRYPGLVKGTRHVWVKPAYTPVEFPGLVLGWRSTPDGWEAQVTYVERGDRVVIHWIAADQLRPVASSPQTHTAYG